MIGPIHKQEFSSSGRICPRLKEALLFWLDLLRRRVSETKSWSEPSPKPIYLFVDAASTPARLAAVLIGDGGLFFSDAAPPADLMAKWERRGDNQIMSLVRMYLEGCVSASPVSCVAYLQGSGRNIVCPDDFPQQSQGEECCTLQ